MVSGIPIKMANLTPSLDNTTSEIWNNSISPGLESLGPQHLALGILAEIISIAGIIGNLLVVIVMLRPTFWRFNISIYLLALALADGTALIFRFLGFLGDMGHANVYVSVWGCRFVVWFKYSLHMIASWLLVEVSIERAYVVGRTIQKTKSTCKRSVPIAVITTTYLLTFILLGAYILPGFGASCTQHGVEWADSGEEGTAFHIVIIGISIHTIIPALILVVTNTIICVQVYRYYHEPIWTHLHRTNSSNSKLAWMLVIDSCGFVVLTVPQIIMFVYLNQAGTVLSTTLRKTLRLVFHLLDTVNHALGPLLYTLSGSLYRNELLRVFRAGSVGANSLSTPTPGAAPNTPTTPLPLVKVKK